MNLLRVSAEEAEPNHRTRLTLPVGPSSGSGALLRPPLSERTHAVAIAALLGTPGWGAFVAGLARRLPSTGMPSASTPTIRLTSCCGNHTRLADVMSTLRGSRAPISRRAPNTGLRPTRTENTLATFAMTVLANGMRRRTPRGWHLPPTCYLCKPVSPLNFRPDELHVESAAD